MHLLYCDETNLEERSGVFFVYGGISFTDQSFVSLSAHIDALRQHYRIPNDFPLKFNPRPQHLSHEEFISLKEQVIRAAVEFGGVLFTSFILHDVATSPNDARINEINRICYHYWCYLNRAQDYGLVLIDQFDDKKIDHHLREKFHVGIKGLPYTPVQRMDRILGFHYCAIGQSNSCSVIDIVLGSLRFAINAHSSDNEAHRRTARTLLNAISPMFFREAGQDSISEIGMFFSPKVIKAPRYREQYSQLHRFISDCGLDLQQAITGERNY